VDSVGTHPCIAHKSYTLVLLCMGGGSVHLHTVPNGYMFGKVNRLLMHPPVIAGLNSMPA
jgi:hypothetical protein